MVILVRFLKGADGSTGYVSHFLLHEQPVTGYLLHTFVRTYLVQNVVRAKTEHIAAKAIVIVIAIFLGHLQMIGFLKEKSNTVTR